MDSRVTSMATSSNPIMAPTYMASMPFHAASSNSMVGQQQYHQQHQLRTQQQQHELHHQNQNSYVFNSLPSSSSVLPQYSANYAEQEQPHRRVLPSETSQDQAMFYGVGQNRGYVYGASHRQPHQSPTVKAEAAPSQPLSANREDDEADRAQDQPGVKVEFKTGIDTLMKAVQAKEKKNESPQASRSSSVVSCFLCDSFAPF